MVRLLIIAATLAVVIFAAAASNSPAERAHAGEQPMLPMRIAGQVRLAVGPFQFPAPRDATVEALIDGNVCGATTTLRGGGYLLGVLPDPPFPGCGVDGDVVTFRVTIQGRSKMAEETVTFVAGGGAHLNLTVRLFP